tara:strand:- start:3128 stop:3973 length:846 start_codon:yes stop_codon:yes gene_type:complete
MRILIVLSILLIVFLFLDKKNQNSIPNSIPISTSENFSNNEIEPSIELVDISDLSGLKKYVINLQQTYEGRHRLDKIKLLSVREDLFRNVEIYPGIYGKTYDYRNELEDRIITSQWDYGLWKNQNSKMISMSKGEIGCMLSHYNLWKKILESQKPALILEDDAIDIHDNFYNQYKHYIYHLPKDFDIFLLGFWLHKGKDGDIVNPHIYRTKNFVLCHAYIISPKGIQKLMNLLPIDMPLDSWLSKHSDKLNIYNHSLFNANNHSQLIKQRREFKQIRNTNN